VHAESEFMSFTNKPALSQSNQCDETAHDALNFLSDCIHTRNAGSTAKAKSVHSIATACQVLKATEASMFHSLLPVRRSQNKSALSQG